MAVVYLGFRQHEWWNIALTTILQADNPIQRNSELFWHRGYIYNVTFVGVMSHAAGWNFELCRYTNWRYIFQFTNSRTTYIGWNRITIALWWPNAINFIRGLNIESSSGEGNVERSSTVTTLPTGDLLIPTVPLQATTATLSLGYYFPVLFFKRPTDSD